MTWLDLSTFLIVSAVFHLFYSILCTFSFSDCLGPALPLWELGIQPGLLRKQFQETPQSISIGLCVNTPNEPRIDRPGLAELSLLWNIPPRRHMYFFFLCYTKLGLGLCMALRDNTAWLYTFPNASASAVRNVERPSQKGMSPVTECNLPWEGNDSDERFLDNAACATLLLL